LSLEEDIYNAFQVMKPQLVILLDVSAKNSTLRKPDDLDFETAEKARRKLLEVSWCADKVVTINANNSISDVDQSIILAINTSLSKLSDV
jgi:thymidylate kinase